jgi:hypothetical protein
MTKDFAIAGSASGTELLELFVATASELLLAAELGWSPEMLELEW